jgi:hypothetical protein
MFKYNNTHIFTGYLKQLLSSVNIPACKIYTKEFAEYLIAHGKEDPRVIESIDSVAYNDDGEAAPDIPVFEDCFFENLLIRGIEYSNGISEPKDAIEFIGFEENGHFIKNVRLKNITLDDNGKSRKQSISLQCCEGLSIENIYCR